ncbi:MAG TPA: MFS transporter [Egibacteraceae bacterium]|nr:MFS transporter [Egibacteraceae bacterium]
MCAWLAELLGLRTIPRRVGVTDRAAVLALWGRFVDELGSGLPLVLLPTLQGRLGLSVTQTGWCLQALYGAAAVVEPVAAAALDLVARRPLLVWGALGWGVALLMVAGAPTFGWLAAAFLLMGAASGPLAQTTDVLLVEMHPGAEERIGARQTMLDTTGALLAPAAVALTGWASADPRLPLVVSGCAILGYAGLLAATPMPGPGRTAESLSPLHQVRANAVEVLGDREARIWLVALLGETLMDIPALFEPVWLAGDVGASQSMVAVHAFVQMATALVGLALLDRWLPRYGPRRILTAACVANLLAYPAWLLVPGVAAKLVLVVPVTLAVTPVWPLVRARALMAVAGRGGTVMAITSLYGVLPLPALFGWSGGRVGLTPTMIAVHTTATLVILAAVRRARVG